MHGNFRVVSSLSGVERLMEAVRRALPNSISQNFEAKQSLVFVVLGLVWKHMQQNL